MSESRFRISLVERVGQRFFYGWVIVAVAMLAIFASGPAQSHMIGVFKLYIITDLQISNSEFAWAYGSATLVAAFCLPMMGRFLDRVGARRMLTVVTILLSVTCLLFSIIGGFIWLALGFAALRFLGQGSLMLGASNMVSQWFHRRRGFALGLLAIGFAISISFHTRAAQWLIELVGWREAWLWVGGITLLTLLPPIVLFVISKPEDVGLSPDGVAPGLAATAVEESMKGPAVDLTLAQALRTPAFYIIAASLFSLSMLVTALHFEQVSIFAAQGLTPEVATTISSVTAVTMILLMPTLGRMLDRFRTEYMFAGGLLVLALTLLSASQITDIWSAAVFAFAFGAANAVSMTYYTFMWPRYFGRRHLGSIQGTGQMIGVVGASIGPLPLALAQDYFGSYNGMLVGLAIIPISCAVVAALFLRQPNISTNANEV